MILNTDEGIVNTGENKKIPFDSSYLFYFEGVMGPSPVNYPYLHANSYDSNGNITTRTQATETWPVGANGLVTLFHTPIIGDPTHPIVVTHNVLPVVTPNYTVSVNAVTIKTYDGTKAPIVGDMVTFTYYFVDNSTQPTGTDITNFVYPEINE
jgi:hypothetical protein